MILYESRTPPPVVFIQEEVPQRSISMLRQSTGSSRGPLTIMSRSTCQNDARPITASDEAPRQELVEHMHRRQTRMSPQEILAYWAEDDSPSVFGRTGEDAVTIARRLRQEAERRSWPAE